MEIIEIINYLTNQGVWNKVVSFEQITLGASGAKLFTINDGIKNYVLKVAHESFHCDEEHLKSYRKEYDFYKLNQKLRLPYVPKIIYAEVHLVYGILLVMECYRTFTHEQWDFTLQKRAVDLCAKLNSVPTKQMLPIGIKCNPMHIDKDFTRNSYHTWLNVIEEHNGKFNRNLLDVIYKNVEEVCSVLNSAPQYVCHGDFHPENILTDGEQLYICDWQGVNIGKCVGDISFFISRGLGFGIQIDTEKLLAYYCERLSEYIGIEIESGILQKERSASTLLVTFSFWANYLKNASYESVSKHFFEMENAAKILNII
ncbi:MAG: hypothetical protein E7286_09245 [Lachnospiraceae bacterium]|nr:hypothetical protein [Lachnospiraceae bacterium]